MTKLKIKPVDLARGDEVRLITWTDGRYDPYGHDPRSTYVEQFWLSILGPSTTWFLRICASKLDGHAAAEINLPEIARILGIGYDKEPHSAMVRTIVRACQFGTARPVSSNTLAVRHRLPPLTHRQLQRLPRSYRRRHEDYIASDATNDCVSEQRRRARRLALGLVECGDTPDSAELQLERWTFQPSVAADAVRWALGQHHRITSATTSTSA